MFRKKTAFVIIAGLLLTVPAWAATDEYVVDNAHSTVEFTVTHLVISEVSGKFNEFSGTIHFDENDITNSKFMGTIQTASIDTGNEKRDAHLRSADFFNVEKYPEIKFESNKVVREGSNYYAVGDFTMGGVTKEIRLPFEFKGKITNPYGKEVIALKAEMTVNRQDYNVSWSKSLDSGGLVVSDEVEIELNIQAAKK
ncbi:MAG: polyisoprenoid-binding protein [candidate division Zixibacteria bacterium]|nr:polyisoprenoid-binding protein [candidate division Zixibacteria bacterium]